MVFSNKYLKNGSGLLAEAPAPALQVMRVVVVVVLVSDTKFNFTF